MSVPLRRFTGAVASLALFVACPASDAAKGSPSAAAHKERAAPAPRLDPAAESTKYVLPTGHLDVEAADGKAAFGLEVELATTPDHRERGLMWRRQLAEGVGMLFVFPDASPRNFWMRNTLIPLDLLFADAQGVVLGVVARAEPLTLTGRGVPGDARYVLEVNGGWAEAHGIGAGAHLRLGKLPVLTAE